MIQFLRLREVEIRLKVFCHFLFDVLRTGYLLSFQCGILQLPPSSVKLTVLIQQGQILSHHVIKDPDITIMLLRHYPQNLPSRVAATRFTTMLLRHYLQNLPSIEQRQQDDVIRAHYDSDVIVYFIPENRTKTQLLSGFGPVRVTLRSLMRIREIKQRKWQFLD